MFLTKKIKDIWRKNAPELVAWWNGSLPEFVTASQPCEPLGGVPVFCYHMVESASFEEDLRYLQKNGYETLCASELVAYLAGTLELPERSVLLSFDDGPRNFFDVAFPLLQRYGAKAITFIAPGLHVGADEAIEARPMTWAEMQQIHSSGLVEFFSHTLESRYVPKWPLPAPLAGCKPEIEMARRGVPLPFEQDLIRSRQEIEKFLQGACVDQLSFPMYLGTNEAVKSAQSLGFKACYWGIVEGRPLNRPGDSPYYISRVSDEFLRRLPGDGRVSMGHLLRQRWHRVQAARAWRRRYGELESGHV